MAEIVVDVEIRAPPGTVWKIISDVDNEPTYWKGTKSVRNISRQENTIRREITIAFRDQKCMQDVILYPEEKIEAVFTDGIIKGTKTVSMEQRGGDGGDGSVLLRTVWDVKMTGMMGMFTGMLKGHIRNGTEMAMQSIKEAAEKSV
ncbi:MAG: SRPBCC family protein [Thaumarchaeota archaeon]|nr:SRPBCC family protein [Nitrososphaerota archaeon]MDE0267105.1 SRPBCC family protein [Nitrososphaerota archaeon]MDE0526368.1 SRPBCC family protein [Nitrososphaerota archaeon]